ncbi:MAG TPA: alpha-hydroxy acid oxidase [Woeseiaceae bacterium]|nr:alpha-hydroxy acid oxidase [Woeseiaceae bacterium]
MSLAGCHNIADLRRLAQKRLPAPVFHYLDGGADDELSLARNTAAFADYELLPTQLADVSRIVTRTTLFGQAIDWPVMISPTGASRLFHGDGEPAVARAAATSGIVYSLSTLATTTIADTAAAASGPKLFQLYVFRDRGLARELLSTCREHGFVAVCLTADTPVAGNRERDFVHGFSAVPRSRVRQAASYLRHPRWLYRAVVQKQLEMVNLTQSRSAARIDGNIRDYIDRELERALTWKDVEWLANEWRGPLVVKGVQTVADCRRAADSGATAVMLSNHGGRQLESSPAPIDCVAPVADALHDRLEIICDGGIRRGNHIVKAIAAGASACGIGRAYLYGLAAGGQAGVERALAILRTEFERTMALVGCNDVACLAQSYLHERR